MKKSFKTAVIVFFTVQLVVFFAAGYAAESGETAPAKPRGPTKNVILMIMDGMNRNHLAATNYYFHGAEIYQDYERFPVTISVQTYSQEEHRYDPLKASQDADYVKIGATDSSAAATAMSTGVKTLDRAVGVDRDGKPLKHISQYVKESGLSVGIVTDVQISHATPAGFVAHHPQRGALEEVSRQMITESRIDLLMGTGHPLYNDDGRLVPDEMGEKHPLRDYRYVGGKEVWKTLIDKTATQTVPAGVSPWIVIQDREEFLQLASATDKFPDRVLGVAKIRSTLQMNRTRDKSLLPGQVPTVESVPTLAEMTHAALNFLSRNPKGFFLMVEAGAIDWAGHGNDFTGLLEEVNSANRAAAKVVEWIEANSGWGETLFIVTSDHETGYLVGPEGIGTIPAASKGVLPSHKWLLKGGIEAHVNSLVPLFAKGAGSDIFLKWVRKAQDPVHGLYIDNTEIFKTIMEAFFGEVPGTLAGKAEDS